MAATAAMSATRATAAITAHSPAHAPLRPPEDPRRGPDVGAVAVGVGCGPADPLRNSVGVSTASATSTHTVSTVRIMTTSRLLPAGIRPYPGGWTGDADEPP